MKLFTVGSRGSRLALAQTHWVMEELKKIHPDVDFEVKVIKTKGDQILDKALDKIGEKGLFIKELEVALLDLTIDFAVHSMKDMPSEISKGLKFAKTPRREDPRDVLVLREGLKSLEDVPVDGTLGTGSKRRIAQIRALRPDLNFVPVRGNIETRMDKIVTENLDGVVLAAAGLHRLDLSHRITCYLETEDCIPAPAQGALAIEYREDDFLVEGLLQGFGDLMGHLTAICERGFLETIGGSCHVPIGAFSMLTEDSLNLRAIFGDEESQFMITWEGSTELPMEAWDSNFPLLEKAAKELGQTAAVEVLTEMNELSNWNEDEDEAQAELEALRALPSLEEEGHE